MTTPPAQPRRRATQARSRATVEKIVASAAELVAERGGGQVTMTEIAQRSGVVIGSLYQYFSDRSKIMEALLVRHNAEVMETMAQALEGVRTLPDFVDALGDLNVGYFERHQTDAFYRSIWSAVQTDADLQALDVEDTLDKAAYLRRLALPLYREVDPDELMAACALVLQLALSSARFALALPEPLRRHSLEVYNRMSRRALLDLEARSPP